MFENISKKQEKVQEKIQKQQELNDDKNRELTDEELDQIGGGQKISVELLKALVATGGIMRAITGDIRPDICGKLN